MEKEVIRLLEQIVATQRAMLDQLTAIKNEITNDNATDRYRRNEVCRNDCAPYRD